MKKLNFRYLILSALIISAQLVANADVPFRLDGAASKMVISGTSSVHDWEIEVSEFECDAVVKTDENETFSISDVNVVCEVENVKSHNKIMDNKTYKALDGKDHPKITFKSTEQVTISENGKASIKGKLNIAGISKEVVLPFTVAGENDSSVKLNGKIPVKMSDYGIEPPTAMMGALKTGDEVVISYDIVLQKPAK
ncbi:YceI family protein [Maribellus mangrovi]|uniref:YceI family protein n=1 Tax=Maribellus mangrovi TaxID=3133146 RepID=UPI0030EC3242